MKQIHIENALARFAVEERDAAPQPGSTDSGANGPSLDEGTTAPRQPPVDVPLLFAGPAEGRRETVQARALLEKAERVREKVSAEDGAELDRLTERVRVALTDRAWGDLTAAGNELADVLFYLEDA